MTRTLAAAAVVGALAVAAGCQWLGLPPLRKPPPPGPPTFSQYHLEGWEWGRVDRVLVLPFLNESTHTRAGREIRDALTSKLQEFGRFEVVAAPPDDEAALARLVHRSGQFDEAILLDLGRTARADVIVHGTVTHYSPYPRPRLGLVLQAIGPREGKAVASVDGLWDTTDLRVAERVRTYYRQTPRPRPPFVRNHVIANDDSFAGELALDSPALFQRFVCQEAALALLGLPVPGIAVELDGAVCPR